MLDGTLSSEPSALLALLPDTPDFIYARALLIAGAAVRLGAGRAAALVSDRACAVLLGGPDPALLSEMPVPTLFAREDASGALRAALPGWSERPFVVHVLPAPYPSDRAPARGVVVSAPLDRAALKDLPEDVRADALDASAGAVRFRAGVPVAVCFVSDLTEGLWDVGIDTVDGARRQGHATAVFAALAGAMAARGRQPVWAAYEDYLPSLALAAALGFQPVARMCEFTAPARSALSP